LMSLRARLLAGLLGLCLAGLLAAGIGTYVALRSFLYSRVDQQLFAARRSTYRVLGFGQSAAGTIDASLLRGVAPDTFIEVRDSANHVVALSPAAFRGQLAPAPSPCFIRRRRRARDARSRRRCRVSTLALGAFWMLRAGLRPLERIAETAGGIAHGDLDVRVSPADERSEIGRLGLALNGMLERLEDAFSRRDESEAQLRRFVSSASHELRTPLTSIRGYAALFRRGAQDNPEGSREVDGEDRVRGDPHERADRRHAPARPPGRAAAARA
jgi:HAMP domain-containing protein